MPDTDDIVKAINKMYIGNQELLGGISDTLKRILAVLKEIEMNTRR